MEVSFYSRRYKNEASIVLLGDNILYSNDALIYFWMFRFGFLKLMCSFSGKLNCQWLVRFITATTGKLPTLIHW